MPHSKHLKKILKILFWVVSIIFYLFALFLLLEVGLRLYSDHKIKNAKRHFSENNVFSYGENFHGNVESMWAKKFSRYKPNAELQLELGDGQKFIFQTNSKGYRTKEFGEKPVGVFRVIAIGGSTTVQGLTNDTTYPALLEHLLKSKYPNLNIEVLNLGISGAVEKSWRKRFNELISYQPDLVLQYNAVNTLRQYETYQRFHEENPWHKTIYKSYFLQKILPIDTKKLESAFSLPTEEFLFLRNSLEERNIEYVASSFAFPGSEQMPTEFSYYLDSEVRGMFGWGRGLSLMEYKKFAQVMEAYNQYFREFVDKHNIHAADVQAMVSSSDYFIDVCHMKAEGIKLQAKAFFPEVESVLFEKGLIDQK